MADISKLPSTSLRATSVAVEPPRPTVGLDAQNEDLSCLGEEMVALDGKTGNRSTALQGPTVDKEILPVLGRTTSLSSFRTASTELYVLPHSKGKSLQDGCVSSFKGDLQNSRQRPPVQKLDPCNRDKTSSARMPEITKKNLKKRKRSQTELATADVETAVGRVVSAAEAIVVGQLLDTSSVSPGQDRSIILEAVLSLGKARHLCGLDKFDLDATTRDFGESELQDLDHKSMQEAYADVGMIVEDERQHHSIGAAVVNLSQQNVEVHTGARCPGSRPTEFGDSPQRIGGTIPDVSSKITQNFKSVKHISHSSDGQWGSIVAQQSEFGGLQRTERTGENVQVRSFGTQEVKQPGNIQLPAVAFTIETSNPLNVDGLVHEERVKEPSPSCKSMAMVSSDSELEIGDIVIGDRETKIGRNDQDTELVQEVDAVGMESKAVGVSATEVMQWQQTSGAPVAFLSRTSHTLEGGSSQAECSKVKQTTTVPTQSGQITCWPQENSEKAVAQAPNSELVVAGVSPNSEMVCGDFLLQSSSMVESVRHRAEHQEEIEGENAMDMEISVKDNKVTYSLDSSEHHIDLSVPSKAMASSDSEWSHLDLGKSSVLFKGPHVDNTTRNLVTPYVSRWVGGWSSNAEFNPTMAVATDNNIVLERSSSRSLNDIGSEDAMPEQHAFLARRNSIPVGQETTACRRISVDEAVVECFAQNAEATSEKPNIDSFPLKGSHSQGLDLSQIDSLCSFVPCSNSAPASVSLLPCLGDDQSSVLAATVEACARTAMIIIDSRKVVDCQKARGAMELESVPDPAVRRENEVSSNQILETRIDHLSLDDVNVKRVPTLMKKFSTTTTSLSLLLQAVDIAGKSCPKGRTLEGGNLEQPSTRSLNVTSISRPRGFDMQGQVELSANFDTEITTNLPDVTFTNRRSTLKEKTMSNPDLWMCADLSDSPPLLWPRGKKQRLTACRVVDSDSTEWLHDYDDHHTLHKDCIEKEQHTLQNVIRQSGRLVWGTATRSKPCHESKALFKGLQFLLTGFSSQNRERLSKIVKRCGGELLADVPRFSPKQRFKRKGVDCGARSPPIVIAPQQMRTHKYLYGCAVGAPLLDASWINASVSADKNLPYHQYHHKRTRAGCILPTNTGCVKKSSESPLFVGFQFLFHGQQDFISQLSTLAKHAGGKVIRKLVFPESERKQRQNLVGLVLVEGSSNLPVELQRAASTLDYHVVDSEWMIVSLFNGNLLPFPTSDIPPRNVLPSQQSSASKVAEPLQRYSRRRVQLQSKIPESREDGGSGIKLLVKKLKHRSLFDESRPSHSSARCKPAGKELEEQCHVNPSWLGKGFTSPPQVPHLADRLRGPYSHSLANKKIPKKFLYYESFLCDGVEYFLGDIVELRAPTADCPPSLVRIEGLWSEEDERRFPQTRAFRQGVRKQAYKNVVLKCRRFYRPSDTGFHAKQGSNTTNELYLSNDIDKDVSASHILRRVRVKLETADEVVYCKNWCDDVAVDDQERAAGSSICHRKGTPTVSRATDYFCSFFYDHVGESLCRIKLEE